MTTPRLSIGITTRDRRDALIRCVKSIDAVAHLDPEILVFDDASTVPATTQLAGQPYADRARVIRDEHAPGYIAGRNRLMRHSSAPYVLLLDDDAALLENGAVDRALAVLDADERVAAVAFAQADSNGNPWDVTMQASRSVESCYVPSFIGFAHLLRRRSFSEIGGYRESFEFYGEEKDFCLRLIEGGYRTVYLPDGLVMHAPDSSGRSRRRYLRYVTRNDCLNALYNEPLSRLIWVLPARLALFFRMRRAWQVDDRWGWAWIVSELAANVPGILRDRRPVSTETVRLWKELRLSPALYKAPVRER